MTKYSNMTSSDAANGGSTDGVVVWDPPPAAMGLTPDATGKSGLRILDAANKAQLKRGEPDSELAALGCTGLGFIAARAEYPISAGRVMPTSDA